MTADTQELTPEQKKIYRQARKEFRQDRRIAVDTYFKLGLYGFNAEKCIEKFENQLEDA